MNRDRRDKKSPELTPQEELLADIGMLESKGKVREYFMQTANTILEVNQYFNDERFDKVVAIITMNAPDPQAAMDAIRMYGRHNNRLEEQQRDVK